MKLLNGWVIAAMVCGGLGISTGRAAPPSEDRGARPLLPGELHPQLDGKEVTVQFTIAGLNGIAQRTVEGQAPSFAIKCNAGTRGNVLDVWVEGELANVLDRLQMSFLQENELKAGTAILATGKLRVHTMDPRLYHLSVTRWQGFRVLPANEKQRP